jgi:hypothetical protein
MMLALALLVAAAEPQTMSWEGSGEVYPGGKPLAIAIRTRVQRNGEVLSESWPVAQGEEKGMRRLRLSPTGGSMEIGGKAQAAPPALAAEERKQFGFYWQLQEAARRAKEVARAGANTFSVEGPVRTWFRTAPDGTLLSAENVLPSEKPSTQTFQTFRFVGWWRDDGALFPKRMEMSRDGQPYFTLDVAKFDAN